MSMAKYFKLVGTCAGIQVFPGFPGEDDTERKLNMKIKIFLYPVLILILVAVTAGCSLLDGMQTTGNQTNTTQTGVNTSAVSTVEPSAAENNETQQTAVQTETTQQGKVKTIKVTLYFSAEDNSTLKKEEREIQVTDGAVLKACVLALIEGPKTQGLRSNIPEGTKLLGVNLKDKVAIVDFSKEFAAVNGNAEITERFSVVNTLTGIKGVDRVKIRVEGKDLTGPSGKPFGEMGPVALDTGGVPAATEEKVITLYFGNSNADKVIAEMRKVEAVKGEPPEGTILTELIKGPRTEGLHPTIPSGTKVLSVKTVDGLCTLDLSREFVDNSPGGTASEAITINSIVDSLTELDSVKKVQFLIEGKKQKVYTHVVFDKPFSRNAEFIGKQ